MLKFVGIPQDLTPKEEAGAEQEVFLSEQSLVLAYVIQPLLQSAEISYLNKESIK